METNLKVLPWYLFIIGVIFSIFSLFVSTVLFLPSPLIEEAASVLGKDEVLLARVMEWCEAKDHAGVRGEANRLLAALIRHSRNPVSFRQSTVCVIVVMWNYSQISCLSKITPSVVFKGSHPHCD